MAERQAALLDGVKTLDRGAVPRAGAAAPELINTPSALIPLEDDRMVASGINDHQVVRRAAVAIGNGNPALVVFRIVTVDARGIHP